MYITCEDGQYYLNVYNNSQLINKLLIENKKNLWKFGVENYDPNVNLTNVKINKETELQETSDASIDITIDNSSNNVEIPVSYDPVNSSGVVVKTNNNNKGVNVIIKDDNNQNVTLATNVRGGFSFVVRPKPNDEEKVIVEVVGPEIVSEPVELNKKTKSKVYLAQYDSNDNFEGYEVRTFGSMTSDIVYIPESSANNSNIEEVEEDISEWSLNEINDSMNEDNEFLSDLLEFYQNNESEILDILPEEYANDYLRFQFSSVLQANEWVINIYKNELNRRGVSYTIREYTVTRGYPYRDSGIQQWAFSPGDFPNQSVVIGVISYMRMN